MRSGFPQSLCSSRTLSGSWKSFRRWLSAVGPRHWSRGGNHLQWPMVCARLPNSTLSVSCLSFRATRRIEWPPLLKSCVRSGALTMLLKALFSMRTSTSWWHETDPRGDWCYVNLRALHRYPKGYTAPVLLFEGSKAGVANHLRGRAWSGATGNRASPQESDR